MSERDITQKPWAWLTESWPGPILSLIALVSSPLAFVEERGLAWTSGIAFIGAGFWWCITIYNAWEPETLFSSRRRRYSVLRISLWALLPISLGSLFVFLLFTDLSQLNLWRRNFSRTSLVCTRSGTVNKFFGDTAPRTTPSEREQYERAEWIRLLELGVGTKVDKAQFLFVETAEFDRRYHTFAIDVHDLSKQCRPLPSCVAFLVANEPHDPWRRKVLRQVPCDLAGDGDSRLFRVLVENPNPNEFLWLFVGVTPVTANSDFSSLNLHLMVRQ